MNLQVYFIITIIVIARAAPQLDDNLSDSGESVAIRNKRFTMLSGLIGYDGKRMSNSSALDMLGTYFNEFYRITLDASRQLQNNYCKFMNQFLRLSLSNPDIYLGEFFCGNQSKAGAVGNTPQYYPYPGQAGLNLRMQTEGIPSPADIFRHNIPHAIIEEILNKSMHEGVKPEAPRGPGPNPNQDVPIYKNPEKLSYAEVEKLFKKVLFNMGEEERGYNNYPTQQYPQYENFKRASNNASMERMVMEQTHQGNINNHKGNYTKRSRTLSRKKRSVSLKNMETQEGLKLAKENDDILSKKAHRFDFDEEIPRNFDRENAYADQMLLKENTEKLPRSHLNNLNLHHNNANQLKLKDQSNAKLLIIVERNSSPKTTQICKILKKILSKMFGYEIKEYRIPTDAKNFDNSILNGFSNNINTNYKTKDISDRQRFNSGQNHEYNNIKQYNFPQTAHENYIYKIKGQYRVFPNVKINHKSTMLSKHHYADTIASNRYDKQYSTVEKPYKTNGYGTKSQYRQSPKLNTSYRNIMLSQEPDPEIVNYRIKQLRSIRRPNKSYVYGTKIQNKFDSNPSTGYENIMLFKKFYTDENAHDTPNYHIKQYKITDRNARDTPNYHIKQYKITDRNAHDKPNYHIKQYKIIHKPYKSYAYASEAEKKLLEHLERKYGIIKLSKLPHTSTTQEILVLTI